jgi:hypothetical protein
MSKPPPLCRSMPGRSWVPEQVPHSVRSQIRGKETQEITEGSDPTAGSRPVVPSTDLGARLPQGLFVDATLVDVDEGFYVKYACSLVSSPESQALVVFVWLIAAVAAMMIQTLYACTFLSTSICLIEQ